MMRHQSGKILVICLVAFFAWLVPSALADTIGTQKIFYTDPTYSYQARTTIVATAQAISERAYFYVENNWWNSLNSYQQSHAYQKLKDLAIEFDSHIYPDSINFFGNVWDPGIDDDSRITVLLTPLVSNAGGYFDSCNMYKLSQCDHSNQREMIIASTDYFFDRRLKSFVGHELQHLINWNQKERLAGLQEDVWLNEMKSEYSTTMLGYNNYYNGSILAMRLNNFINDPYNPLGEWQGQAGDYGVITLFANYLADHFGSTLFSKISQNGLTGIIGINQALKQSGYSADFSSIFTDWTLANYYNDLSLGAGSKYGYTSPHLKNFKVTPTVNNFYDYGVVSFSERVKNWSPRWYLLKNKLNTTDSSIALKVEFSSDGAHDDFRVPYMINYKNGQHELGFVEQTSYIFNFAKDVDSILIVPSNQSKMINFTDNDPSSLFSLKASTVIVDQPVITKIYPGVGSIVGGNVITIQGGNFKEGTEVYFGGLSAGQVEVINETTMKVIAPPNITGPVNVWVKTPDGKNSVFAQGYEYIQKEIKDGSLIRAQGDYKVYIVQGGYIRHIVDGRIFDFYGHLNWDSVIEVSQEELALYQKSNLVREINDAKVYDISADKAKHWLNMTAEQFILSGRQWPGVFIINQAERDFYRPGAEIHLY